MCVRVCVCEGESASLQETVKDRLHITVMTPGEHQHLVLKVIQSPERNIQIAAISLLDYNEWIQSVWADKNPSSMERPDDKQVDTLTARKKRNGKTEPDGQ